VGFSLLIAYLLSLGYHRGMKPGRMLREARRRAGMSQRELAQAAGVPQATVARVESGAVSPRADTYERLLRAAGSELAVAPRLGSGVDRTLIRDRLALSAEQRVQLAIREARAAAAFGRRP
jgi:transcriptional regulator with XRE-family HTH domain